jgi:hypothetical protein
MYNTFNGWKRLGRVVEQGQFSGIRNEYGDKMFHVNQTVPRGAPPGYQMVPVVTYVRKYY